MTEQPSYIDLVNALQATDSPLQAPEVHGLICGLICATNGKMPAGWENLLTGPSKDPGSVEVLERTAHITLQEMSEFSFEFTLLLPDDGSDINQRAECLGLFCQGFITGLKQTNEDISKRMTPEVQDALKDLVEIAQVRYEDIISTEEDETAYFELAEYVRLVVLMIYHDLRHDDSDSDDLLLH